MIPIHLYQSCMAELLFAFEQYLSFHPFIAIFWHLNSTFRVYYLKKIEEVDDEIMIDEKVAFLTKLDLKLTFYCSFLLSLLKEIKLYHHNFIVIQLDQILIFALILIIFHFFQVLSAITIFVCFYQVSQS